MTRALTTRQREVLAYMRRFLAENDQMPPLQWIADHFGYRAAAGAQFQVLALKRKGYLEANATGKVKFVRGRVSASAKKLVDADPSVVLCETSRKQNFAPNSVEKA